MIQEDTGLGLPRQKGQPSPEQKQLEEELLLDTVSGLWCHLPAAGPLGLVLAPLWVPASRASGHTVGFAIDSKFPDSCEMFCIDGLGIKAGNGRQRA